MKRLNELTSLGSVALALTFCVAAATLAGCTKSEEGGAAKSAGLEATRDALTGDPVPSLLLTHAWFYKDADGNPRPGPARLDIWRNQDGVFKRVRLEDPDSNVFHKAIAWEGGILTIGAEKALLKKWTFEGGKWQSETLWERDWGGRFQRLRDIEIGDVDGDGKDELVIATHDSGVVAVIDPAEDGGKPTIVEMDQKADTFVHEIEIADIDGDGKLEFFATPSDRNKVHASQAGGVTMYRFDGTRYVRSWVEEQEGTHAKEIFARDLDGDGKAELFAVLEAEIDPNDKTKLVKPVEIRQYDLQADGSFKHHVAGTIDDRQTRFLVGGNFDGKGGEELVAAAFRSGLWYFTPPSEAGGAWERTLIDGNSSGFEHAAYATDLDGDGIDELYVAADDQRTLKRYDYDAATGAWSGKVLARLEADVLTWNITTGNF